MLNEVNQLRPDAVIEDNSFRVVLNEKKSDKTEGNYFYPKDRFLWLNEPGGEPMTSSL